LRVPPPGESWFYLESSIGSSRARVKTFCVRAGSSTTICKLDPARARGSSFELELARLVCHTRSSTAGEGDLGDDDGEPANEPLDTADKEASKSVLRTTQRKSMRNLVL
jgi:hypothetical protein